MPPSPPGRHEAGRMPGGGRKRAAARREAAMELPAIGKLMMIRQLAISPPVLDGALRFVANAAEDTDFCRSCLRIWPPKGNIDKSWLD